MIIDKKHKSFVKLISLLFITLLLIFIFFYPKFDFNKKENLEFLGNLSKEETKTLILNNLEEGDIVLGKPTSFNYYHTYYMEKNKERGTSNIFFFIFYYNLFNNLFIRSMGEDGYWHAYIYVGNNTFNSLFLLGVEEDKINDILLEGNYLKILRVNTTRENKLNAIKNAESHLRQQDIYYSLKNGLIIVFAKSTGLNHIFSLDKQKLVCSSYIALLYKDISFNLKKDYTYITPVDIEDSNIVKTILITKKEGVYYAK